MDAIETNDLYEIVVERYRRASMVFTSNRKPKEWLSVMADPMLAQRRHADDRPLDHAAPLHQHLRRSAPGRMVVPTYWQRVVPSSWQATTKTRIVKPDLYPISHRK
jgi:hypothetical protein